MSSFFRIRFFWVWVLLGSSLGYAGPPFRLLTLNINQFPYGLGLKNHQERAEKLAQIIREKQDQYDVIAFQEVWSNRTRDEIYRQIQTFYPHRSEDRSWGYLVLGFHSGLAIYSKYPIRRKMLITYRDYRGFENLAKKGLMGVEIEKNGKPVYVFTTHLQAGPGNAFFQWLDQGKPRTDQISLLQLQEAETEINRFVREKDAPIFLAGDFNITALSEEYHRALQELPAWRDTFDPNRSHYQGTSWNDFPENQRIDFILTRNLPPSEGTAYSVIVDDFGPSVTDHPGVLGFFEYEKL